MAKNFLSDNDIVEKVFNDEWHEKVSEAISYSMELLERNGAIVRDQDSFIQTILDYNIQRTMTEKSHILKKAFLPEMIVWEDCDPATAFSEFRTILTSFTDLGGLHSYRFKIYVGNDKTMRREYNIWEKVLNAEYKDTLSIESKTTKDSKYIKVTLKRL